MKQRRHDLQEQILKFALLYGDEYKKMMACSAAANPFGFISEKAVTVLMSGKFSSITWGRIMHEVRILQAAKDDPDQEPG